MSIYRGRFAPSPTGPLHFGSLFAAVISYLEARYHHGEWLIRIEDIDPLREETGASTSILQSLSNHALESDLPVIYQSNRFSLYQEKLDSLIQNKRVFACPCSRKYLSEHQGIHSAQCLRQQHVTNCAYKFTTDPNTLFTWLDTFQGTQERRIAEDFVLKRKEGFYAYQLAVVCDDIAQGVTNIVRGYDLIESTPMQLALYEALGASPPIFAHFPVITSKAGQKLSKQNKAPAINNTQPLANLLAVFSQLNLTLKHQPKNCQQALEEALECWNPELIRGKSELIQDSQL